MKIAGGGIDNMIKMQTSRKTGQKVSQKIIQKTDNQIDQSMISRRNHSLLIKGIFKNYELYLLSLSGLIYLIVFKYVPMYGITIAFKDFNIYKGIFQSPWVGFDHFIRLFTSAKFLQVFTNTLLISIYKLIFTFPAPIILALLLNEIRQLVFKKAIQTISYIPHFISWVVVSGMFLDILSPNTGILNKLIKSMDFEPIFFMGDKAYFRSVLVVTQIWKEVGWGAIVYLAAIAGINPELYEAAIVDGASKLRQVWHITLNGIKPTIAILLLLRIGNLLNAGHEQILTMYNPAVYEVADVLSTYVFRVGLGQMEYSFTTAVDLFNNIIGCVLLFSTNHLVRRLGEQGIW